MKTLEKAIESVVEGDLVGLSAVLRADHSDLLNATAKLPQLSVTRSSLLRVLEDWRAGRCTEEIVQQRASFIRRGYVSGEIGRKLPVSIDYDAHDEELIVEIISRLDQIGDAVDGYITGDERSEMISSLEKPL